MTGMSSDKQGGLYPRWRYLLDKPGLAGTSLAALLVGLMFVTGDSLWIDEGNAVFKALQGSISRWAGTLVSEGGSDAQMPGYMFFIWAWAKVSSHSEFGLRMSNLLWLMLAVIALRQQRFAVLALLASPFILYYANELRPYMMQIAASAIAVAGIRNPNRVHGWWQALAGCLLLCASSLTGVVWAAGLLTFIMIDDPRRLGKPWFWVGILATSPFFLTLGVYYFRSLLMGQGAAAMGGGLLTSLGAVVYELLGLMGLGPGRIELRTNPRTILDHAFLLAPAATITGTTITVGGLLAMKNFPPQRRIAVAFGLLLPLAVFLSLIFLKDFRLLGRHLAPLSVLIVLCTARVMDFPMNSRTSLSLAIPYLGWLTILFGLASSFTLRFAERHRKDDYRTAAMLANEALHQGREVLWLADGRTGEYYGIRFDKDLCQTWNAKTDPLPVLTSRERVIMTKPDIVDPGNKMKRHMEQQGFQVIKKLQAFTIWEATPPSTPLK